MAQVNIENVFEIASREKYRFPYKGSITTEDLWDLSVINLDVVYREINEELKNLEVDSLLIDSTKEIKRTTKIEELKNKILIVKYIFETKTAEEDARKKAAEKAAQKKRLKDILADKQEENLKNLSVEELQNMINSL